MNGIFPGPIVNPYKAVAHPYPTRFHGAIYTRPEFGLPFVRNPHNVLVPSQFAGLGCSSCASGDPSLGEAAISDNETLISLGLLAIGVAVGFWYYGQKREQSALAANTSKERWVSDVDLNVLRLDNQGRDYGKTTRSHKTKRAIAWRRADSQVDAAQHGNYVREFDSLKEMREFIHDYNDALPAWMPHYKELG